MAARRERRLDRRSQAFDPAAACPVAIGEVTPAIGDRLDDRDDRPTLRRRRADPRDRGRTTARAGPKAMRGDRPVAPARAPATAESRVASRSCSALEIDRGEVDAGRIAARAAASARDCARERAPRYSPCPAARASRILATTVCASSARVGARSSVGAMSAGLESSAYAWRKAASPRAVSDTPGSTRANTSLTQSTTLRCDRKLRASSTTPTGTLATRAAACASMNSRTSAWRKR